MNAGTRRPAIWRVALIDARDHPLLGEGGGGLLYSYLRERQRDSPVSVRDAHSVELENLSEFGVPGLLLFAGAIGAAGLGAARARRLGPEPALLSIIALTAGAYWLVHSSLDWFWPYPAVTAPVFALLGSACAPALRTAGEAPRGHGRRWLAVGAVVLAISAVPPYLSERYVNDAYDEWPADSSRAYDDLDRAQALNPLSARAVLAEGAIARANGDRARAIDAFRRAASMTPEEWASHYNLAELYARSSPRLARRKLAIAKRLNPYDPEVLALEERFAAERRGGRDSSRACRARSVLLPQVRTDPARSRCRSADVDHAVLERHGHGLGSRSRPELGLGVSHVGLHGRRREHEHLRDLIVGGPRGQEGEHFPLAGGRAAPAKASTAVDPGGPRLLPRGGAAAWLPLRRTGTRSPRGSTDGGRAGRWPQRSGSPRAPRRLAS